MRESQNHSQSHSRNRDKRQNITLSECLARHWKQWATASREGGVVGGFCRHLGALKCSTWRSTWPRHTSQSPELRAQIPDPRHHQSGFCAIVSLISDVGTWQTQRQRRQPLPARSTRPLFSCLEICLLFCNEFSRPEFAASFSDDDDDGDGIRGNHNQQIEGHVA